MIEHHDTGLSRCSSSRLGRTESLPVSIARPSDYSGVGADAVVGKVTPAAFHDPDELRRRREALAAGLGKPIQDSFGVLVARVAIGRMTEDEWTYLDRSGYRFPVFLRECHS